MWTGGWNVAALVSLGLFAGFAALAVASAAPVAGS